MRRISLPNFIILVAPLSPRGVEKKKEKENSHPVGLQDTCLETINGRRSALIFDPECMPSKDPLPPGIY